MKRRAFFLESVYCTVCSVFCSATAGRRRGELYLWWVLRMKRRQGVGRTYMSVFFVVTGEGGAGGGGRGGPGVGLDLKAFFFLLGWRQAGRQAPRVGGVSRIFCLFCSEVGRLTNMLGVVLVWNDGKRLSPPDSEGSLVDSPRITWI